MLKPGFFCALCTPVDEKGFLNEKAYAAQIDDQIKNGAAGLLVMGTMGKLGCIRSDQYERVVKTAVDAAGGRVTVMVGAADNSLARVAERMDQIRKYDVAAVLTAPYYSPLSNADAVNYFIQAAEYWGKDFYLYDHPYTARYKCNMPDMKKIMKSKNVKGIKTGDYVLLKSLYDCPERPEDFAPIFSNSDLFVVARPQGVDHYLDGIFASFPKTIGRAEAAYKAGDNANGKKYMDAIMHARDEMFEFSLWPMVAESLALLGYPACYGPDYEAQKLSPEGKARMREIMVGLGEI